MGTHPTGMHFRLSLSLNAILQSVIIIITILMSFSEIDQSVLSELLHSHPDEQLIRV